MSESGLPRTAPGPGASGLVQHQKPKSLQRTYSCSSVPYVYSRGLMAEPKLSKLELRIMEVLGIRQHVSLRDTSRKLPRKKTIGLHDSCKQPVTPWKAKRQSAASKRLGTFTSSKLQLPVVRRSEG